MSKTKKKAETFTLKITLGNAAMRTPLDVADALRRAAAGVERGEESGTIRDVNGNTVGTWRGAPTDGDA